MEPMLKVNSIVRFRRGLEETHPNQLMRFVAGLVDDREGIVRAEKNGKWLIEFNVGGRRTMATADTNDLVILR